MNTPALGKLLAPGEGKRDAIHVCIVGVEAAEVLQPGQHVGLDEQGRATSRTPHIGYIDPVLTVPLDPGDWAYLCVFANTVTSLRHQWTHDAFRPRLPARKSS